jgi:hypothetical protein
MILPYLHYLILLAPLMRGGRHGNTGRGKPGLRGDRGERPTVERVRGELGGGSPNNLTPLVRAWNDARKQLALPIQKPAAPPEPSNLPPTLQRALTVLTIALDATMAEVTTAERRQARSEIEAATAVAQKQIDEMRQQAEDERAATEAVRAEAGQLERAIADKDAEIAALLSRLEAAQATMGELRAEAAVAKQRADSEQQRAERAEAEAQASRQERIASETAAREAIARAAKGGRRECCATGRAGSRERAGERARRTATPWPCGQRQGCTTTISCTFCTDLPYLYTSIRTTCDGLARHLSLPRRPVHRRPRIMAAMRTVRP